MPIFDYKCEDCGEVNEFVVFGSQKEEEIVLDCPKCGSRNLKKLISAHALNKGSWAKWRIL